ncbi:GNAT family N-acetyltransferase [Sinanaerobacter sp. ZZT-01]|uniref:GNAT family N-acetyltransferase n=1 Tax=Sinanaerobacter sp. ZZT-01 TaxID=3111540 RepID=UPI002D782EBB|nr:GNAT family N-acetyltransferase [Sinanaerobacter sp. ZZT-01]WRR92530.1 GNAT family N-acetyltransferase [Sinanaerobacter sp. ZZT-01]
MVKINETKDYLPVMELFLKNDLEMDEEELISPNILHCWKAETEENLLIGGCVLAYFEGEYIIDGIAVEEPYRKSGTAKALLNQAVEKARQLGAKQIFLVARAPEFFRKQGFQNVGWDEPPAFFDCYTCPQRGQKCFPEVMKLVL